MAPSSSHLYPPCTAEFSLYPLDLERASTGLGDVEPRIASVGREKSTEVVTLATTCGDLLSRLSFTNISEADANLVEWVSANGKGNIAPGGPSEAPPEEWKQVLIFLFCFLGVASLLQVFFVICMQKSLTSFLSSPSAAARRYGCRGAGGEDDDGEGSARSPLLRRESISVNSINSTRNIPFHARVLVPSFLLVTILVFASANLSVGASVELNLEWSFHKHIGWPVNRDFSKRLDYGPAYLFEFSLANTVSEMYKAGVYILALLVLCWSGIWPYLKLVLLLSIWFVSPKVLGVKTRGRLLVVFDSLGKWCLMDVFLMTMMSVAFRFHIETRDIHIKSLQNILPGNFVLDVSVVSEYGMYGFVVAAMLSLLMNHVVLAYHRTATSSDTSVLLLEEVAERGSGDRKESKFCFPCPNESWFNVGSAEIVESSAGYLVWKKDAVGWHVFHTNQGRLRIGMAARAAVALLLLCAGVLTVVGAFADSFEFKFIGIAGELIEIVQPESRTRRFSMITIVQAMNPGNQTLSPPSPVGVYFLQGIYLLFAFVMPLVQIVFLFALWLIPMTLRDQKIVLYVTEMVSSWSALDVFIVSIIASIVQINQFAQFLVSANVGDLCEEVKDIVKTDCFGVETSFLPGCWLVVAAASILLVASTIIMRVAESVVEEREYECMNRNQDNTSNAPIGLVASLLRRLSTSN